MTALVERARETGHSEPGPGPWSTLRHATAIARRNLVQVKGDPGQLMDATVMPMAFTLVFVYVFGGAVARDQQDYLQFLIPGIMVQTLAFATRGTGVGLSTDFGNGLMDRFRAMPIARSSVLVGRIMADMCRLLLGQLVMLLFAVVIGFRVTGSVSAAVAALGVLMLYGMALSWVSAFVGLALRSPQTVQTVGFLWTIPLQFGSSMFVPTSTMPGWLQAFASVNPTSLVIDLCRALLLGGPVDGGTVTGVAVWVVVLVAVFAPAAVACFRRRT